MLMVKKEFQTEAGRALVEKMMSPFDAHFRIQFHHFDLNLSPLVGPFVHVGKPRFEIHTHYVTYYFLTFTF